MASLQNTDSDYKKRMDWLVELIRADPDRPIQRLQAEALERYPTNDERSRRHWMGWRVAFASVDIAFADDHQLVEEAV